VHNLQGKSAVTLSTFGGLVSFAGPDSLPSGVSPRCHDCDFSVGSVTSRKGTRGVYSFAGNSEANPGSHAASTAWSNPSNAYSTTLYASAAGTVYSNNPAGLNIGPLTVTQFAFNIAQPIVGIEITLNGTCNTGGMITAQLVSGGVPIGESLGLNCPVTTFGAPSYMWGASPNVNDTTFGVQFTAHSGFSLASFAINSVSITVYMAASACNFQYVKSFQSSNGDLKTLAIDAGGEWWYEDVTNNPGVLNALMSGIPAGSYAKSITANDREYVCFSNLATGTDIPRQYTGDWIDRITQVGPGAPPAFTPQIYTGNTFAISSIVQPPAKAWAFSYFLQSAGPGSTAAGNVVTFYYGDANAGATADSDIVNALNSGYAVYVYASYVPGSTGGGITQGPYVVQVLSAGLANPPGQPRPFYYFTFAVPTSQYLFYRGSDGVNNVTHYQRTLATMTTVAPVPGLQVGSRATIASTSVANYNSTWTIAQTLNSGAMVITQTSVTAGVASFSYALSSGVAPASGELVTVTGTTNANGVLNVTNATIANASGGPSGTFTVNTSAPTTTAAAEQGQATTAGTLFAFDPGFPLLGSSTSPIYGNATGGNIIFAGTSQYISPGTRQGVVFFGTRNSAETFPSIPVTFTIPTNTSTLVTSQIPIGPPDTAYRQIAITEAGQNGVPGGDFYTIDNPITYTVNGIAYNSTSFRIPNNTDTTISLTFRDSDLYAARRIDVQGEDLFNQVEIGNPAWVQGYAGRLVYGLTQTKVPNFINLSFDGGYLPATTLQPLGWSIIDSLGALLPSPAFGNSYYVKNLLNTTVAQIGTITQTAYRDFYQNPIILPTIPYSVRVSARNPSGLTTGNLVIDLYSANQTVGSFTIPFASMGTTMQTFTGVLTAGFVTVPTDLLIRVYGTNMGAHADYEIDRFEVFPTRQPVNNTLLLLSYSGNPEGVDGVTGMLDTNSENSQPCYGAAVMYDLLYLLKDRSMYYTQDSSGDEPSDWGVHEVSNKAGACGPNAYDSGEEWILMACRNGIYVFNGGEPQKISQEIQQVWDALNWSAGKSIWVRNDVAARKFYVGVPLPTPNFWLPDAPTNAAPAFPNVVVMCSYEGQSSGGEVVSADPMASTFYGDVLAEELKRKWTIQQIPSPYADFITQANGEDAPLLFGNGIGNSKIYTLDATNDDGAEIPWRYVTYGFGADSDVKKFPALGPGRKRWSYLIARIIGAGSAIVKFWSNRIDGTVQYTVPGGMILTDGDNDRERPLNSAGNRVYVEFSSGGINSTMDLSAMTLVGTKDTYNAIRGAE
jgi:hypothetical protein